MIKSKVEWTVWTIIGILMLGAVVIHYAGWFVLPEQILVPVVFLLGVYATIYFSELAGLVSKK